MSRGSVLEASGADEAPEVRASASLREKLSSARLTDALGLGPVCAFLTIFFVAPIIVFFLYSFWTLDGYDISTDWTLSNYTDALGDPVYRSLLRNTFVIAGLASVVTVLIAYGFAHALRFHLRRWQELLLLFVLVALFSGYLVRIYAWRTILGERGIINNGLQSLGIIDEPLSFLLYNRLAAVVVLTNFLLPVAVLPIYAALQNVRDEEVEVARDLGCGAFGAFRRVTLPLVWPGIFFAFALAFVIAAGDYVTPLLVGGTSGGMVGKVIADTFNQAFDWPRGAALAFLTLGCVFVILMLVRIVGKRVVR